MRHDEAVPMPARGPRLAATTRLHYDDYREMTVRAKARGWSISDYIAWCVARELRGDRPHGKEPPRHRVTPSRSPHVVVGDYGD